MKMDFIMTSRWTLLETKISKKSRKMHEHVRANHTLTREEHDNETLRDMFSKNPFKIEIMNDKIGMDVGSSAYRQGDFVDLCLGPMFPQLLT